MEKRVELAWLLDFYGPLLTENRRAILALYLNEDLSLAEIAEQEGITRQGVYDAIHNACAQLEKYEDKLGLLSRYRRLQAQIEDCRAQLERIEPTMATSAFLQSAREALDEIEWNER